MRGKCCEKNRVLTFRELIPELESTKCQDSVFVHSISPLVWDSVLRPEMFGLLKDKIPLVCQAAGYSLWFGLVWFNCDLFPMGSS